MISKFLQSPFLGGFALFGAAIIYAMFGLLIRAMAQMFGDNTQVAIRFGLVALVLVVILLARRMTLRVVQAERSKLVAFSVGCVVLVALFTYAVTLTTIVESVFALYAGSMVTSLLIGTLYLKESLTKLKVVALLVALGGLVVYSDGSLILSLGGFAAFGAGVLDGVTNTLRKTLHRVGRLQVQFYQNAVGAVCAVLFALVSSEQAFTGYVALWPILATVLFVFMMIGLGYMLLYGFQHFDVNVGTIILATELFFATVLGVIFFREVPSWHQILGGLMIFIASILTLGRFGSLRLFNLSRRYKRQV
jgi:drug/metabolite transporter (DMT)-like permease